MKAVLLSALLVVVAFSTTHAASVPENVGNKIPGAAIIEAVQNGAEEWLEFASVGGGFLTVSEPETRGLLPKCDNGECRRKCNAKRENGACLWFKCICWK